MSKLSYVQIRPDLFLACQPHEKPKQAAQAVKPPVNHIWIYDRSGSMYSLLSGLVRDLKDLSRSLKVGDTLTLGWFSSERDFNFMIKGFKITGDSDYALLDKLLDQNSRTLGTTCFSDILADTKQVVQDLKIFSSTFALSFFTDGYPVVSNYNREVEAIFSAIKNLQGDISSALLVGYGYYYNKQLMADMAERLGGSLTHAEGLKEFRTTMDMFLGDSRSVSKKIELALEAPTDSNWQTAFTISGNAINLLAQENNSVSFAPTDGDDYLYTLTSKRPSGTQAALNEGTVRTQGNHEPVVRGLYAAAYVLCQKGKTDVAMEALSVIGESYLIDKLTNAYTPAEYGFAEKALSEAIQDTTKRYVGGYKPNYLPATDAFCLLDVCDLLAADGEAFFYPFHETFDYKRVGVKSTKVDDAPDFKADADAKIPFQTLTWNSKMLNLSVLARIEGKIELRAGCQKAGLPKQYPTNVYRNYTIVKDGFLNMKSLPISVSKASFDDLQGKGLIDGDQRYDSAGVYTLHLDRVPVINRKLAEGKTSAKVLADKVIDEMKLKGQLKALKYFKDQEVGDDVEKIGVLAGLSDAQVSFLEEHYVTKNGFSPKVEKEEATDHYFAKEFEVKVKGLSSLPKVEDVKAKLVAGKKLTVSDEMVAEGIRMFESSPVYKEDKNVKIAWLNNVITNTLQKQQKNAREIQETKFAVLLAKKWFDEFKTRDENALEHNGYALTFALREVKVAY